MTSREQPSRAGKELATQRFMDRSGGRTRQSDSVLAPSVLLALVWQRLAAGRFVIEPTGHCGRSAANGRWQAARKTKGTRHARSKQKQRGRNRIE